MKLLKSTLPALVLSAWIALFANVTHAQTPTPYVNEVQKQVLISLEVCDRKDTTILLQAKTLNSLYRVNLVKDSVIHNRDSTLYEERGRANAYEKESKYLKEEVKTLVTINRWEKWEKILLVVGIVAAAIL